MKKFIKWCAVALGVLLVLLVVGLMFVGTVLKRIALAGIERQTGLVPSVEKFDYSPRAGILRIEGFKLHEQATNGGRLMVDLPELYIEIDPVAGEQKQLRFREIRIHLAEVVLTTNQVGGDLDRLLNQLEATRSAPGQASMKFDGIDRLTLTLGSVKVPDPAKPGAMRNIPFNLQAQSFTNVTSTNLESIVMFLGLKAGAGMLLGR